MRGRGQTLNCRGFTLLELVVVVVLIGLLTLIALQRFAPLRVRVEQTGLEQQLGITRSGLAMEVANYILADDWPGILELVGSNPFALLVERPENYLGELKRPQPAEIEAGNWYFDRSRGELVYLVRFGDYLQGGISAPPRVRFRIQAVYDQVKHKGAGEQLVGLALTPVEPYRWLLAEENDN